MSITLAGIFTKMSHSVCGKKKKKSSLFTFLRGMSVLTFSVNLRVCFFWVFFFLDESVSGISWCAERWREPLPSMACRRADLALLGSSKERLLL